ncbi:hypothetical protein [Pseudonocardia sp. MH-G8]|uniref:hypothetical protein n=1 Tax=Pseudonocardia sp. MH-G8 TaxID=1854588 RepID=UPI001303F6CF|nr:hypothetical protein [Pseudonocardia sp. MH-G8]
MRERAFLARLPELPGRRFVLLARDAARRFGPRTVYDALRAVARDEGRTAGAVTEIWLGVEGLAVRPDLVAALARESGLDVLAPIGRLAFASGSAVFACGDVGDRGWWRSAAGAGPEPDRWRFPPRAWEHGMPDGVLTAPEATVSPVMAGVVVRGGGTPPVGSGDLAFHVVGDEHAVRIIVDEPCPAPESVAALLADLPGDRAPVVVALARGAAEPRWLDALQAAAGGSPLVAPAPSLVAADGEVRTVVLGAAQRELFDPFPTTVRVRAGGGQEVVTAAAPPPGWASAGPAAYAPEAPGANGVRAHVVASGLVLTRWPAPPPSRERRFDPTGWTLEIGRPGELVDPVLTRAATGLLDGLTPARRAAAHVRTSGRPLADPEENAEARRSPAPEPLPVSEPVSEPVPVPETAAVPGPALPPSPSPVPTSTSGPGPVTEPVAAATAAPDVPEPDPEPAAPVSEERVPDTALQVVDRDSTAAERTRFAAASGEQFTEALATVNAAMATWPALRGGDEGRAKADLAAVCLYLDGREGTRASVVDDAVRRGREGVVDGHLPCLVSGLRRLPVHRRPVLRQGVEEVGPEQGAPGRLLGEPGFLTASADLDVTVADARYDVLIMPATARRTAELVGGGPVAEAVFPAGSRYRTLGMRTREDALADGELAAPRIALLLRELSPDEDPSTAEELDVRDRVALGRLERALAGRRRTAVRVVSEPAVVARLTRRIPLVGLDDAAAGPRATGRNGSTAAAVADAAR